MKISVLMPIYNGSSYLDQAIDSVLRSTYKNFELLLVDDGSNDSSPNICLSYEKKYHDKIRYIRRERNHGLAENLNFGLKHTSCEFVARINQDDRMKPKRLQTQLDFMINNTDIVACGSNVELFFDDGHKEILKYLSNDSDIKRVWHLLSPFSDTTVMYKKSLVIQVGGYMQNFWPADDTHLWMRLGLLGKLANIQDTLMEVRWHKKAASVVYFKTMTISTYKMHQYAHNNIQKASIFHRIYWFLQFVSGTFLSPEINWKIYRIIKKITNLIKSSEKN